MNDQTNDNPNEAALIVFGRPNETRAPRAAWYRAEHAEGARIAALEMNFLVLDIDGDETRVIVPEITEGRFSINGRAQIPAISVPIYERLVAISQAAPPPTEAVGLAAVAAEMQALAGEGFETNSANAGQSNATEGNSDLTTRVANQRPDGDSPPVGESTAKSQSDISAEPFSEAIIPAIIVFGKTGLGRPRGGWFTSVEAPIARKSSETQGLRWLTVRTKDRYYGAAATSASAHRRHLIPKGVSR